MQTVVTDFSQNMPMSFDLMDNIMLLSQKFHCWINLSILSENVIANCAYFIIHRFWEFPGSPAVMTRSSHCWGPGFDPWSEN